MGSPKRKSVLKITQVCLWNVFFVCFFRYARWLSTPFLLLITLFKVATQLVPPHVCLPYLCNNLAMLCAIVPDVTACRQRKGFDLLAGSVHILPTISPLFPTVFATRNTSIVGSGSISKCNKGLFRAALNVADFKLQLLYRRSYDKTKLSKLHRWLQEAKLVLLTVDKCVPWSCGMSKMGT